VITAVLVCVLFKIRIDQTAKLESLLAEIRDVAARGAPQKQQFMKLTRENPQTLPEYLQRCAELEPVVNDYSASEQQMDDLLAEVQQQIGELRPQGSYGAMLPMLGVMRAILAKDLEGAKIYKQEVDYAKQLPSMSEKERIQFYNTNIEPVLEREHEVALDEIAILKDAKTHGIAMPANMLQDAGLN
jgi:rubrerythrin